MQFKSLASGHRRVPCLIDGANAVLSRRCVSVYKFPFRSLRTHPTRSKCKKLGLDVDCIFEGPVPLAADALSSGVENSRRRLLSVINDATKYTVVMISVASVVRLRSLAVAWSLTGSLVAVLLCKVWDGDTHSLQLPSWQWLIYQDPHQS